MYDVFTAYGFVIGRGAPVWTATGHAGSGFAWFSVPGSCPFWSASTLHASSISADAAPMLPNRDSGREHRHDLAEHLADPAGLEGVPLRGAQSVRVHVVHVGGRMPAAASALRITFASPGPVWPRSTPLATATTSP